MAFLIRWTVWNLTPDGWQHSETVDIPDDTTRYRPPETVLSLLLSIRTDIPDATPHVTVLFRSPDDSAVANALAKFGEEPPK